MFFGNPLMEWLQALGFFLGGVVLARALAEPELIDALMGACRESAVGLLAGS